MYTIKLLLQKHSSRPFFRLVCEHLPNWWQSYNVCTLLVKKKYDTSPTSICLRRCIHTKFDPFSLYLSSILEYGKNTSSLTEMSFSSEPFLFPSKQYVSKLYFYLFSRNYISLSRPPSMILSPNLQISSLTFLLDGF